MSGSIWNLEIETGMLLEGEKKIPCVANSFFNFLKLIKNCNFRGLIPLFKNYVLSTYYMPGNVLGSGI